MSTAPALALLLAASILAGCGAVPAALAHAPAARRLAAKKAPDVAGHWVMTIVIGNRTFEDRVTLVRGADGAYSGELTVVGLWTAPLERITHQGDQLAFELLAPEGDKPFRVRYAGTVSPDGQAFIGVATLPDEGGQQMGAFRAVRAAARRPAGG